MTTIALLSPGAMGAAVGARLREHGARVLTALDGRSAESRARATAAGMADAPDEALVRADLVLSIVPPADAEAVVQRLLPALRDTPAPVFVDLNALAPATKLRLAGLVEEAGATFVDGCIIGGPPRAGTPGPAIYVAGAHAERARQLAPLGLHTYVLDGPIGTAAALKMCYSGINKGLVGLATAMLRAADRAGAADALRAEMARSMPDLARRFARQVPDMYPKAHRWVAEMEEIAAFLAPDAGGAALFEGMARLFDTMAQDGQGAGRERAALDRALALDQR